MISRSRLFWTGILLVFLLFVSGCTGRPFLTKENSYSIHIIAPEGEIQEIPIQLSWNTNAAVLQKLLLEASFVLSDLKTQLKLENETLDNDLAQQEIEKSTLQTLPKRDNKVLKSDYETPEATNTNTLEPVIKRLDSEDDDTPNTTLLEAKFPKIKQFNLIIDNESLVIDVSSIQIEVEGKYPGRVTINKTIILQGIPNPNLKPAYDEFMTMFESKSAPQLEKE